MKIREFDENSLVNYYPKNVIDFSWIDKPSQHQFRWRCLDGSWNTAKRRIRDHKTLLKAIKNDRYFKMIIIFIFICKFRYKMFLKLIIFHN